MAPALPIVTFNDQQDGSGNTATITGADPGTTNEVFAALQGATSWISRGSVVGNGAVDQAITIQGRYWGYVNSNLAGDTLTMPQEFFVTNIPGESQRILRRDRIRDAMAGGSLKAAKALGVVLTYQNPGEAEVSIFGFIRPTIQTRDTLGGETNTTVVLFDIPRQPGFPPASFELGAVITYNSIGYQVRTFTPDNEDIQQASMFTMDCKRFEIGWEDRPNG